MRFHVRRRFAEASGRRGTKHRPEVYADSLNVPLAEDNDTTRMDKLEDPDARYVYEDLIERVSNRQQLMTEVDRLPNAQRDAIRFCVCEGRPLREVAARYGCAIENVRQAREKGLRAVRRSKTARRIEQGYAVRRVGLTEFRSTHTSEIEAYIHRLEERGLLNF